MEKSNNYITDYFSTVKQIVERLDFANLDEMVNQIKDLKLRSGRLFIIGVGGSAGNASHAVNDFRKLAGIESYSPTDNVSELTARTNDEGWETVFSEWLIVSKLCPNDIILVLSVGGGSMEKNVSVNISSAIMLAKEIGAKVIGIVGKDNGDTAKLGDTVVVIPEIEPTLITPMAESFQALIWHMIVMHPEINTNKTKW